MSPYRRYLVIVLGLSGGALALILGLSLLLGQRAQGSPAITRAASEWQERTRGVTYAPPVTHSRPFKSLRLADRIAELDTMVLGASSVMGVTQSLFPPPAQLYNFALTANATAFVVGEAEHLERQLAGRVGWLVVGLDWSLGFIYLTLPVPAIDLAPAHALAHAAAPAIPWARRLPDALTRPRLVQLASALRYVATSGDPAASFVRTFLDAAGAEYRCPDGALARDFDVVGRGQCRGFRHDGSFTFGGERPLSAARAAVLARAAAAPSSKFTAELVRACGEPNPEYLRRLGAFARRYAATGGHVVFLLPPLVPGLEREILRSARAGACLRRTKAVLGAWAAEHGVAVVDAGQSERFGCEPGEFLDENHAFPECHGRVLARYWADHAARRVAPGLYPADAR